MAVTPGLWLYLQAARYAGPSATRRRKQLALHENADALLRQRNAEETEIRPDGPLIWVHAAPGSRLPALVQLIARLTASGDRHVLLTTSLPDQVPGQLPDGVIWRLRPVDTPAVISRFLEFWRPAAAVFEGSELWPSAIEGCHAAGVPLLMIDAHVPREARRRWRWAPFAARRLLSRFSHLLTGSEADAEALQVLGADPGRIETLGFLEESTPALPCNETERDELATLLSARPVWLAAGACSDEIAMIESAHRQAARQSHRLLMICVPNLLERGPALRDRFNRLGWGVALRSAGEEPEEETQIYIADTEGEMGLWYRLAPITFIGNTLAEPGGGHDPYEPAALGSAVVHGPRVQRHEAIFSRMGLAGAARRVSTAAALGETVAELMAPDKAAEMAHRAWEISSQGAEVSDRAMALIEEAMVRGEAHP
ncbi:MAG: glycosyltransferase N-terminal domain-containing protein [Pseudomonadota bacterium]